MDGTQLGNVVADEIDVEQGRAILDKVSRERLGVSGDDFIDRWERGETGDLDHVAVMEVAMLLPLAG